LDWGESFSNYSGMVVVMTEVMHEVQEKYGRSETTRKTSQRK
jgi:hypothetical protein